MRISGESSSAQHMWQERGAKKEKKKTGFGRRPNLCLRRLWRSQPRRAAGRVAEEQISSNLSALVQGLRWDGCSPVPPPPTYPFPLEPPPPPPPPACPRLEASMPARHTGGGGWSCRMVCCCSAGRRSAPEKEPEWRRAGTGLVSSPRCVFSVSKSTCHSCQKQKNKKIL